ncbi:hypothetical protein BDU57DRAFT_533700 [Ampelomyces quisqualis]|uniref:Uncharacterized protein n=1 Tax=Ampelomyces quisqualis TaxID=50730 RepID=A0A6A5Q8U4_AMPQU|nr:hypothetical protein BDU57DRAFT_533700 [Ampelomyces quisqualis]
MFGYQCLRKVIGCGQDHAKRCPLCRTPWFEASRSALVRVKQDWERIDANEARDGDGVVDNVRKKAKWRVAVQARVRVSWQAITAWISALYRMVPHVSWEYGLSEADEEFWSTVFGSLCIITIGFFCCNPRHKETLVLEIPSSFICVVVLGLQGKLQALMRRLIASARSAKMKN